MRDATITLWALAPFVFALWPQQSWLVPSVPGALFMLALVPLTVVALLKTLWDQLPAPVKEPRYAEIF